MPTSTGIAIALAICIAVIFLFFGPSVLNLFSTNTLPMSPAEQTTAETPAALGVADTVVGTGAEAQPGNTVTVNYVGHFTDGAVFDASANHGQPFSFVLGAGKVIAGWDQGIVGMKVGGTRVLTVPPQLGYGSADYGPIPGNSTLIFEVQLVQVAQ